MMHHDFVYSPTEMQETSGGGVAGKKNQSNQKSVLNQAQHLAYLEQHPYEAYEDDDLQEVSVEND